MSDAQDPSMVRPVWKVNSKSLCTRVCRCRTSEGGRAPKPRSQASFYRYAPPMCGMF
jgi:hypothetical protein